MSIPLEAVTEADSLFRRLLHFHIKKGGEVSSAAFKTKKKKPDPELSVDLARLTTADESLSRGMGGMGLGELSAAVPLSLGLEIRHRPECNNIAHCLILGDHTMETCRQMAENVTVIIPPKRPRE